MEHRTTLRRRECAAAILVAAPLLAGCAADVVHVQVKYNLGSPAACPVEAPSEAPSEPAAPAVTPAATSGPKSKVCTWIGGEPVPADANGFVDGPAKVDVYLENENPFCTAYSVSLGTSNYTPPSPLPGAVYPGTPPSGGGSSAPVVPAVGAIDPVAAAATAPLVPTASGDISKINPGDVRRGLTAAAGRLKKARQELTNLRAELNATAVTLSEIAQACKGSPDPPEKVLAGQKARALDVKDRRDGLVLHLSVVNGYVDSTDTVLISATATAKEIQTFAVERMGHAATPAAPAAAARPAGAGREKKDPKVDPAAEKQRYQALVDDAKALAEEAAALVAEAAAIRAMRDATQNGTQADSLATVAKGLEGVQAASSRAGETRPLLEKSQSIDTYQTVVIDLADAKQGGHGAVQKVTLHTLSPLYIDVGLGPAFIFSDTQAWSIAASPGATVGTVTHSDQPNFDGVVALSPYVWGPRYYDGSLRHRAQQWIPRPMLGLSLKSAFSSMYLGAQIDPLQFIDISFGAYLYSKPEPVNARDGAVVPIGTLATTNVFAVSGFISVTSSINLFAGWIGGVAKSAAP